MAADHYYLLRMKHSRNTHLNIKAWQDGGTSFPSCNFKGIAPHLRSKTLQILDHFLRPISSELIMSIGGWRQISIISTLSFQELSRHQEQLIIDVIRLNRRKIICRKRVFVHR